MGKKIVQLLAALNLIYFISPPHLPALEPSKAIDEYIIDQWKIPQEFPYDSVTSFAQTPDGYLWIGTRDGLVRCSGIEFEKIEILPSNKDYLEIVSCLHVDRNGDLWIGTATGLTRYQYREKTSFKTYTTKDGLSGNRIRCIAEDAFGNLWIGTRYNYLCRFKNGKFKTFKLPGSSAGKSIFVIYPVKNGGLWIGALRDGLFKYEREKFAKYDLKEELKNDYTVYAVYWDNKNVGWIGTDKGLVRITGKKHDLFTKKHGLAGDRVSVITGDEVGNLWVGTRKGLNRIRTDRSGQIKIETTLEKNFILSIFEDAEKSLWVGTFGSGMVHLRDRTFRMLLATTSPIYYNLPLYEDKAGDVLIGINFGQLFKYKNGMITPITTIERVTGTYIGSFEEDHSGDMWMGTDSKGLFHLREGKLTNYTTKEGLLSNHIKAIYCDSRDILWVCTYKGGITCLKDGILKTYTTKDGLLSDKIYTIYEDKNFNIWLGTRMGINVLKDGRFDLKTMKKYLPETLVTALYEDENSVFWIGTVGKGLIRFEKDRFTTYNTEVGFKSKHIAHIIEDQQKNFWISSSDGILHVSRRELNEFARGNIKKINCRIYGMDDGVKSAECIYASRNTAIKTSWGELWFATRKGIAVVSPGKLYKNSFPPPVVIKKIVVDNVAYKDPAFKHINRFKDIKNIEFHFTALTYILPGKAVFKTKLEGAEKDWNLLEPGKERMVRFSHLPRGEYTFRVLACNRHGVWNKSGAAFTFIIEIDFFKSTIFRIMVILLLFIVIIVLLKRFVFHRQKISLKFVKPGKYKKTKLDLLKTEEYKQQLVNLLENEKIFQDETISLQSLAKKLSIPSYLLSQIINEKFHKNFYDLVNSYRIEEAKKRLLECGENELTILEIAFEVGFNSKSAFNRAFKKYTKMNPTAFKNKYHTRGNH